MYVQHEDKGEECKAFAKEINAIFNFHQPTWNIGIKSLFENISRKYFYLVMTVIRLKREKKKE